MTSRVLEESRRTTEPSGAARKSIIPGRTLLFVLTVAVLAALVLAPLVALVTTSLQRTENTLPLSPDSPFTWANYSSLYERAQTLSVLGNTLVFAAGSLILALIVGFGFAWLVERTNIPAPKTLYVLLVAPIGMPHFITAIAWGILLNPTNGVLNSAFQLGLGVTFNVYSMAGMILVQALALLPVTFILLSSALRNQNVSLEEAGACSGASVLQVVRRVTFPVMLPAIVGAAVYQVVIVISTLDIPLVLGLPGGNVVFSTQIYGLTNPPTGLPNYGAAAAYGVVLLALCLVPLIFYNRILRQGNRYAVIGGRNRSQYRIDLGPWRYAALVVLLAFIAVSLILPLLVLAWASLLPYFANPSSDAFQLISAQQYAQLIESSTVRAAILNTIELGLIVGLATMVLATLVSWLITRSGTRHGWIIDSLVFVPHAMPAVVLGFSVLLLYLVVPVPIPIYGTMWILVIAMSTQYLALGSRLTSQGYVQIRTTLEDAASASGANMWQSFRSVMLPLLRPALVGGFVLIVLQTTQSLTLPLLLQTPETQVASTLIWHRWSFGDVPGSAALSVVLTSVALAVTVAIRRTLDRQ